MSVSALKRLGRINALRRFPTRFTLFAIVGVIAIGVGASLAFARTRATPIGTGVVVVETNLAYANDEAAGTGMVLSSSGEILTNNHVIRGATTIRIIVPEHRSQLYREGCRLRRDRRRGAYSRRQARRTSRPSRSATRRPLKSARRSPRPAMPTARAR